MHHIGNEELTWALIEMELEESYFYWGDISCQVKTYTRIEQMLQSKRRGYDHAELRVEILFWGQNQIVGSPAQPDDTTFDEFFQLSFMFTQGDLFGWHCSISCRPARQVNTMWQWVVVFNRCEVVPVLSHPLWMKLDMDSFLRHCGKSSIPDL